MLDSLNLFSVTLTDMHTGEEGRFHINLTTCMGLAMISAQQEMLSNLAHRIIALQTAMLALGFRP